MKHQQAQDYIFNHPYCTYRKTMLVVATRLKTDRKIETHEGTLQAKAGDYLVMNVRGDRWPWPVKKEIFEQTYEIDGLSKEE